MSELIEFADNPEPRAAMVIVIDQSPSMQGKKLQLAQEGLNAFLKDLSEDSLASKRAEVCVLGFAGETKLHSGFQSPQQTKAPRLEVMQGGTAMSQALQLAGTLLEERKQSYRNAGVAYYRPWMVLITDGEPTDGEEVFKSTCKQIRTQEEERRLIFMSLGVEGANMQTLQELSLRPAHELKDVQSFREFFMWLSASMRAVSQSQVGQKVALPAITWSSI